MTKKTAANLLKRFVALVQSHAFRFPLPNGRFHLVTTSPPYADGTRDYQISGQLGHERVIDCEAWIRRDLPCGNCYICNQLIVAAEVWRVLHPTGLWFYNVGDIWRKGHQMMIPATLCLALKRAGWQLVQEIVWSKPNPMPESVKRRPTKSHEMIYMFAKSPDYYCDMEAVKETANTSGKQNSFARKTKYSNGESGQSPSHRTGRNDERYEGQRNLRDVWTIPTRSYSGAHFATWPPDLVKIMVKMGTSERGACPTCGNQWKRVIERTRHTSTSEAKHMGQTGTAVNPQSNANAGKLFSDGYSETKTIGWQPTCKCPPRDPVPALVLDPFCGSGTTLQVARKLGRSAIGLDLSMEYLLNCARTRLQLDKVEGRAIKGGGDLEGLPLFQIGEIKMDIYDEDEAGEFSAIRWIDIDTQEMTGWHLVRGDEVETLCSEMVNIAEAELSNDLDMVDCLECNEVKNANS